MVHKIHKIFQKLNKERHVPIKKKKKKEKTTISFNIEGPSTEARSTISEIVDWIDRGRNRAPTLININKFYDTFLRLPVPEDLSGILNAGITMEIAWSWIPTDSTLDIIDRDLYFRAILLPLHPRLS